MKYKSLILQVIFIAVFVFAILYSILPCKSTPLSEEKSIQLEVCQTMANGYQKYLEARASELIERGQNPNYKVINLTPEVTVLKCISDTKIKVKVLSNIMIKTETIDSSTKKVLSKKYCGTSVNVFVLKRV